MNEQPVRSDERLSGLRRAVLRAVATGPTRGPVQDVDSGVGANETSGPLRVFREEFSLGAAPEDGVRPVDPDLFGAGFSWPLSGTPSPVFWDLETLGLADDPIVIFGSLRVVGGRLELVRLLACDPSGEPALVRYAAEILGSSAIWGTFNGRSFDAPRLRKRAALHRVTIVEAPLHRDLLLEVRRRWKSELPNCRLSTVERRLLGLDRGPHDVPGREVPERYRDFVRSGKFGWIAPVLEHNRRDVAAMAVLYRRLDAAGAFAALPTPSELPKRSRTNGTTCSRRPRK